MFVSDSDDQVRTSAVRRGTPRADTRGQRGRLTSAVDCRLSRSQSDVVCPAAALLLAVFVWLRRRIARFIGVSLVLGYCAYLWALFAFA